MGLISKITGVDDARKGINRANAAQQESIRQATETIQGAGIGATEALGSGRQAAFDQFGQARTDLSGGVNQAINTLNPIAGLFDPAELGQNFTQEGFGQQLAGFTDPQGAFAPLFQQRQQSATNALGAAGLTRSGQAAETAANIDLETALGLSRDLFGRQIQNPALGAIQNQANLQAGLGQNLAGVSQNIAGLESAFGSDIANLQLGQGSNIANLQTSAGASNAQALQAIGGLKSQAIAPFIEAAIQGGSAALTGGVA